MTTASSASEQGPSVRVRALTFLGCLLGALLIAYLPPHSGLEPASRACLFIALFAAGLWVSGAIPAFAVGVLVMGLEIAILGRPGGVFAENPKEWVTFVAPWSSPVIWLFFGGFTLAEAAHRTRLDQWMTEWTLRRCGGSPGRLLLGVMASAFLFSMFISNTAATAMLMAVLAPLSATMSEINPFKKGLILAVPLAANIGGIATVIGSPPNAIAVGSLAEIAPVPFFQWMMIGGPPALGLGLLLYIYLRIAYPSTQKRLSSLEETTTPHAPTPTQQAQRYCVMAVFAATVILWMSGPLHGIPSPVISFLPITLLTVLGILREEDIRRLPWDVLLLLTGGLSLGVAVTQTGLAEWLVTQIPTDGVDAFAVVVALAYFCSILSNLMSNTAAANILIPIALAMGSGAETKYVIPIAIAASSAMCLPVSTPPNAIAYATGAVKTKDFVRAGLLVGLITPPLATAWVWWVLR